MKLYIIIEINLIYRTFLGRIQSNFQLNCAWTVRLPSTLNRYNRVRAYVEALNTESCCDKVTIGTKVLSGSPDFYRVTRYYYGSSGASLV